MRIVAAMGHSLDERGQHSLSLRGRRLRRARVEAAAPRLDRLDDFLPAMDQIESPSQPKREKGRQHEHRSQTEPESPFACSGRHGGWEFAGSRIRRDKEIKAHSKDVHSPD